MEDEFDHKHSDQYYLRLAQTSIPQFCKSPTVDGRVAGLYSLARYVLEICVDGTIFRKTYVILVQGCLLEGLP